MKKYIILAAFAAALAVSSCNKITPIDTPTPAQDDKVLTFSALPVETKTVFGEKSGKTYPVKWESTDEIGIAVNRGETKLLATANPSSDGLTADFKVSIPGEATGAASFKIVSPSVAFKSWTSASQIMVEIPSAQTSTPTGPDPSAQILFAEGEVSDISTENSISLTFSHMTAYLHIKIINADYGSAALQGVNILYDENISGRFYYKNDGGFDGTGSSRFNSILVLTDQLEDVWCALLPTDFSGKSLTVQVCTEAGVLSKSVNLPSAANLGAGKIAKFTVDMAGASLVSPISYDLVTSADQLHYGDEVIIAAADDNQPFAIGVGQNSNNRTGVGVIRSGDVISNPSSSVEIFKLEYGLVLGTWAFKAQSTANPGYLYAADTDGTKNYLRTQTSLSLNASWDISFETISSIDNCARILSRVPSPGRGLMRYNFEDHLFSAYANSTSMAPIKLYRKRNETSGSIGVGTMLFRETFAGGAANETPSTYQEDGTGTTVYGNASVTYTQKDANTKLYKDGIIYLNQDTYNTAAKRAATGANLMNLMVRYGGGWWKIAGIPCAGVKKALLVYRSNSVPNADRTVTTDTDGVTLGTVSSIDYTSEWDKKVVVIYYDITFESTFAGTTFNLQFNNNNTGTNNIRVTDVEIVVTEMY